MSAGIAICAVSGGRADWGLLEPVLLRLAAHDRLGLEIVATGQHLANGGQTLQAEVKQTSLPVPHLVDLHLEGDSSVDIGRAMGHGIAGFTEKLAALAPDLLLVLGDRYEILAAVQAAMLLRIPVAHLCGGDLTEGAIDDVMRHAITKMAHIHFPTNSDAVARICQMGENPANVHAVGSTGLDRIRTLPVLSREEVFSRAGMTPCARNLLVTFHPVTLDADPEYQVRQMLAAFERLPEDTGFLFTGVNADPQASFIDRLVQSFVAERENAVLRTSLGGLLYINAMRYCDAVVGNSSSGLYEAPTVGVPTVNIGDRQKGRMRASSVIDVPADADAIEQGIIQALASEHKPVPNPYGNGFAADRIITVLEVLENPAKLLRKGFFTPEGGQ